MTLQPIGPSLLRSLTRDSFKAPQLRTLSSTVRKPPKRRSRKQNAPASQKIMFQSLGCPRNFVDTEVMLGVSVSEGNMEITQDVGEADVVVVNTCGFLQTARDESHAAIQDMIDHKRDDTKLLVTGCMVNLKRQQEKLLTDFPDVDAVLSSGKLDEVVDTIRGLNDNAVITKSRNENGADTKNDQSQHDSVASEAPVSRGHRKSFLETGETPRFLATPPHYAYLKIAEGCRKQCSFCIIPKLKGRLQSKPIAQIVEEFHGIVQHGTAKEVILIAQDLGDYGKDWKSKQHDDQQNADTDSSHLTSLLQAILDSLDSQDENEKLHDMDDPFWIRLLYLYPDEITPDLIDLMERDRRITRYVDLPIQHSHNKILKAMRRKTSGEQIQDTIQQLRARLPDICIRTSLMVGFPGETEEHFEHLLNFVREQKLDHVGVFMYSNEEMAHSSKLPNHVSENVKQERYHRLMETQWQVVEEKYKRWVKERKKLRVVIEGLHESDSSRVIGRHSGQCPDIDAQVILEGSPRVYAGERYWAEVTGYKGFDLVAKIKEEN